MWPFYGVSHYKLQVESDRVCAVRLALLLHDISVVGVYLPSSNTPMDEYSEYLNQVEECVSNCQKDSDILILGDFNAL